MLKKAGILRKTQTYKDNYYLDIASTVSGRSSCSRRQIGAVIVIDDQVVSTGYNDTPKDWLDCSEGGCPRATSSSTTGQDYEMYICCHAEENAVIQAARHGVKIKGGTIYTTLSPCSLCAKILKNAGIVRVVYRNVYDGFEKTKEFLNKVKVLTKHLPKEK